MGTKYSSNSASGYNSTPPVDDGTVSEANKVKWSTIKTKLADPVKTLADTINSELATHFDNGPNAYTANQTLGATHYNQVVQVSGSGVTLTLSDAATLTAGWFCEIISTDSSNNVTLGRATASDMINETSADVTILPLQQLRVVVNAAANGFLVSTQGRHAKTYASAEAHTRSGIDTHSAQVRWARGTDIGDADVDVSNILTVPTDGNTFDFSGTQQVDGIATLGVGTTIRLVHTSARQLTHHATNFILLSAANITTASGDVSEWYEYATGDWRMTNWSPASGVPLVNLGTDVQTFTSSGTWTKPSGYPSTAQVRIQAWGGGGGGGGGGTPLGTYTSGGGGGGGYAECYKSLSDLGATETVTIGAGGAAGGLVGNGGAGGNTTFGSVLTAYGGTGGIGNTGANGGNGGSELSAGGGATGGIKTTSHATTPSSHWRGGGGGAGGDTADTAGINASSSFYGGGGGAGENKDGTNGSAGTSKFGGAGGTPSANGTQPGGGGGGSYSGTGGAGAAGQVIVTVFG